MLRVKDPVTAGKPPRKLASTFHPDSGHFSVQNLAPSDACIGAVTVNTNKDGIVVPRLTPKVRWRKVNIELFIILRWKATEGRKRRVNKNRN
jgi:hypothetical protein